jgi:putative membrane protein
VSTTDAGVGQPERLHPLFLLTGLGRGVRQLVGSYAAVGYLAATGRGPLALLIAAGVALALVVGVILHWRRFEYRVGTNEIRIDSGILSRTHRSIPFDRIQDVDISQGPVARLLGLARVKLETGASAGDKDDDGALAAIRLDRAEALRELIRSRRHLSVETAASEQAVAHDEEASPVFAMTGRRLLLAGVFNFSLAIIAALFGLTQTLGDVAGIDFFARRFWRDALAAGSPLADLILAHQIMAVLAGTILLLALGLATGIGRTVLRDYRFRLDRTATGLRRRRGLLTLTDVTLPIRRVQAAIVGSGPVRQRFGWSDLQLQSLAKDEGSKGDHMVAPLADQAEIAAILGQIGWRPVGPSTEWAKVSAAYAWGFSAAVSLLLVPVVIQSIVMPWAGIVGLLAVAGLIATRWQGWRRFGYALDGDRLLIRSGWWRRRLVILPLASIQSADYRENIVTRAFGTASLTLGVASGRGYSQHGIPALEQDKARELRDQLLAPYAAAR